MTAENMNPHDNDLMVQAIQKAVSDAVEDARLHDEENLGKLEQLVKTNHQIVKKNKRFARWLLAGGIAVALCVAWIGYRQLKHPLTTALRNEIISTCNSGNVYREGNIKVWEKFNQLFGANADSPKVQQFLGYVAEINAPRDCSAAYSGSADVPTPPAEAKDASVTWQPEELDLEQSWPSTCLSFRGKPTVGAQLNYVACGSARDWQYGSNGQLRPDANLNLAAGDNNGSPVLVPASDLKDSTLNIKDYAPVGYCTACSVVFFAGHSNSDIYAGNHDNIYLNNNEGPNSFWEFLGYDDGKNKYNV